MQRVSILGQINIFYRDSERDMKQQLIQGAVKIDIFPVTMGGL